MEATKNLLAVQKVDGKIKRIAVSVSSVTIYGLNDNKWEKTEYEGPLFICERTDDPRCCIVVLNQRAPKNFLADIEAGTLLQRKQEYLLYKSPTADVVTAMWFYDEAECIATYDRLKEIIRCITTGQNLGQASSFNSGMKTTPKTPETSSQQSKDIMKMLREAQNNFGTQPMNKPKTEVSIHSSAQGLFKSLGSDGDSISNDCSKEHMRLGESFVSLTTSSNTCEDNSGKRSSGRSRDPGYAETVPCSENLQGIINYSIGKGRGRGSQVEIAPAIRQLMVSPGSSSTGFTHPIGSAFSHVGPRPREGVVEKDGSFSSKVPDYDDVLCAVSAQLEACLKPEEDLLTPADLCALYERKPGRSTRHDFTESLPGVASPSRQLDPSASFRHSASRNPAVDAVPGLEQFQQHFLHMLEHDHDFVKRLYELFVQESSQSGSEKSESTGRRN